MHQGSFYLFYIVYFLSLMGATAYLVFLITTLSVIKSSQQSEFGQQRILVGK